MLLYLLRHGDAVPARLFHDSERPLSDLGKQQARAVAAFCSRAGIIVRAIYCSPLVRAQETAAPLRVLYSSAAFITTDNLVPGSRLSQLLDQLNAGSVDSAILVSHEPLMSTLVSLLVSGDSDFKVDFPKAAIALIEIPSPIRKGRGILKWLLPFDHLLHSLP